MRLRTLLPLMVVAIAACQTEIYPEAPTVPARTTTGATPEPGGTATKPEPGFEGGQVMASGQGWLEFAPLESANNSGRVFFAFFPYDSQLRTAGPSSTVTGTAVMTDSTGAKETKALQFYADTSSTPVTYCWPTLVSKRTYTIHATLKVDGETYEGDFTYQAK